jgi:hypothetical protein
LSTALRGEGLDELAPGACRVLNQAIVECGRTLTARLPFTAKRATSKRKDRLARRSFQTLMARADQAPTTADRPVVRRPPAMPRPAKPSAIIAQVDGSGIPPGTRKLTSKYWRPDAKVVGKFGLPPLPEVNQEPV